MSNGAASELAKLRAKKLSKERRSEIAGMGATAVNKSRTKKQRKAAASKAARARWAKAKRPK